MKHKLKKKTTKKKSESSSSEMGGNVVNRAHWDFRLDNMTQFFVFHGQDENHNSLQKYFFIFNHLGDLSTRDQRAPPKVISLGFDNRRLAGGIQEVFEVPCPGWRSAAQHLHHKQYWWCHARFYLNYHPNQVNLRRLKQQDFFSFAFLNFLHAVWAFLFYQSNFAKYFFSNYIRLNY